MSQDTSGSALSDTELNGDQLQIVEVTPYDKTNDVTEIHASEPGPSSSKYMQVLDTDVKGMVQLDLLNLTLVRCEDGEESYRLITNAESSDNGAAYASQDTTVTCVLQGSDGEDLDSQESYVMVEGEYEEDHQESYVMLDSEQGPVVYLQSEMQKAIVKKPEKPRPATTYELLEQAKALNKAKKILKETLEHKKGPGRRRKHQLPTAQDLLSCPNFKLYLYTCKLCPFKCNAIRELTAHRASEHGTGTVKYRSFVGRSPSTMQCARCPYRVNTQYQFLRHVQDNHMDTKKIVKTEKAIEKVDLFESEEECDDILVCGACGFESSSRKLFKTHIEEHTSTSTIR